MSSESAEIMRRKKKRKKLMRSRTTLVEVLK